MYTVWHVNKYKITFKLVINHWANEILQYIVVSSSLSRPGVIDARARYRAAAWRLRNTVLEDLNSSLGKKLHEFYGTRKLINVFTCPYPEPGEPSTRLITLLL